MRTHTKLTTLFLLILTMSGCARQNPMTPTGSTATTSHSPSFVLRAGDPRLPAPGLEESAATAEDRALFTRLAKRAEPLRQTAGPNVVVVWNRLTRELGIGAKLPPPLMARAYALVQVGILEALAVSEDRPRGSLPQHSLAAGVASRVLGYLFPGQATRIEEVTSEEIALDPSGGRAFGAWTVGSIVGRAVVARGMSDGSTTAYTGTPPTGDGIWTGTNPVLPMCGTWRTWVLRSGSEIQPEPPYAFGSAQDLKDVQEVLDVSLARTTDQIAIVHKWADVTPPAIWNDLLDDRIVSQNLDPLASARASAYLNVAMADAFIECWACKYVYWAARPFQRIPGLVTVIPTPNFPSYTSGHSTISAAAAAVLGEVFPGERDYFIQQSEEAALSRLYGGIHFRHDNEAGTRMGTEIGARVVARMRQASSRPLLAGN
jgi:hypothetical protein